MILRLRQRQNKDRAGCMSGIVSIFDLRHGRVTRRLLSDHRTHMTETTTGYSCTTSEVSSLMDSEEIHQRIQSPTHTSVRELMEEEMQIDQTEKTSRRSFDDREINLEDLMNKLMLIHEKRNQEQNLKSLERSNSLDHTRNNLRSEEPMIRKNRNFFRRRSKSHECISLNDNNTPPPSNPSNRFKIRHERSVSHFSFMEFKKKLKNAVTKSSRDSKCRDKPCVDGSSGLSTPNGDRFFSERFSRTSYGFMKDADLRLCESERKPSGNKEIGDVSDRVASIYIEAKKHLYDLLNNEDECSEMTVESHSKTLGKLLSFPGYTSNSSDSGQRNEPAVNESQLNVIDNDHHEPEVSDEVHQAEGVVEVSKPHSPEETEVFDVTNLNVEDEISSPTVSPSRSSRAMDSKSEEVKSTMEDSTGKPSPVSVLELFSDDDISPARTISRPAESSIQPLRIRFEETVTPPKNQETCTLNHPENEESVFEYVEAVLLASDLNWAEFEQRWLSSARMLDPSLYHELQIFSSQPIHDQRFLFDTTNEILSEVCDSSLDVFFRLNHRPYIQPIPKGLELINKVWERMESRLDCHYPRSLDQLIKKDFERSRIWIDLQLETREIVTDIEELVFADLINDTVSFLSV